MGAHGGLVTPVLTAESMKATISLGPLGMGVAAGAELIKTGLLSGNLAVTAAGAIICLSSLVLGYAVAFSRTQNAGRSNDAKAE